MAENVKAQQEEVKAYKKMKKLLGSDAVAFAQPAGFATAFPDFGFRLVIEGKKVDIHVEYKADSKAQMGSMRDWQFDGKKFITPNPGPDKNDLIKIMNENTTCVSNGKRLISDFKKYFHKDVSKIYSGMLTIEPDKDSRRRKIENFAKKTKNYQLANINDTQLGDKIISHYKTKFKKVIRDDADYSILLMMLGDDISIVTTLGNTNKSITDTINARLGVNSIPKCSGLKARLEVRIQPRGLNNKTKPVSIDVMASFRLAGGAPGVKI